MPLWKRLARALNPDTQSQEEWERIWQARKHALESILGPADAEVFHATIPLDRGGGADILAFDGPRQGKTYVTADLSGQEFLGQAATPAFELMMCTTAPDALAPTLLSRLAPYCLEHTLEPGHTMQINMDPSAALHALIFTTPDWVSPQFQLLDREYYLLLAVGITKQDLDFSFAEGPDALLQRLHDQSTYPFTTPGAA